MQKKIAFVIAAILLLALPVFADEPTIPANVGVVDTTPPVITPPPDQTFATSTFPATPALTPATAIDLVDPSPKITYSPTSFSSGTTTVTWTATDASGNSSATTSKVGVFLSAEIPVDVPASCDATDTDGIVHPYEASSSNAYLGICALEAAVASSSVSDVRLSNQYPSLGLFLAAIDGVSADPNSQYWTLYQNGEYASVGLALLPVTTGDTITLQLHDFSDDDLGDQVTFDISSLISTSTSSSGNSGSSVSPGGNGPPVSGGGGGGISHSSFNMPNALAYLASKQNPDGSFGSNDSSMITDWTAIALSSEPSSSAETKLRHYLLSATPPMTGVTDYERHAMALEALGINPYSGTSVNYIAPIIAAFDGTQIGDPFLDNDDIFAIFPLLHAGYTQNDAVIQKTLTYILSQRRADGSWDGSPDMTAAAIQALDPFSTTPGFSTAIGNAVRYLQSTQQSDGGWGTIDSSSWVQTADNAMHAVPWASSLGYYPTDTIANAQQTDGGVRLTSDTTDNRVWSTSYAVSATSGQSWLSVLQSFSRPSTSTASGGSTPNTATSTSVTSTPPVTATSTPAIATSTPEFLATSTIRMITSASTTTATTTTIHVKVKIKKSAAKNVAAPSVLPTPITRPSSETQTAAAANAPSGGLFGDLWHAVTSFFASLF